MNTPSRGWVTRIGWALALLLSVGTMLLRAPTPALAAPANDDFNNATQITALPFTDQLDTTSATPAADDPQFCNGPPNNTVWYALTPSRNAVINVDTFGSDYDTVLGLFTGSRGSLQTLQCNDNAAGTPQSQIVFRATAGTRYFIEVDDCCGAAGMLTLHVNEVPPPANDDFANATAISALPFVDQVDATGATGEPGETLDAACRFGPAAWSVWYAFTPAVSGSVTATVGAPSVAAYTGSSVTALTPVACASTGNPMTFFAAAGTTYHIQVGDSFFTVGSPLTFSLSPAPAPHASFVFQPTDPSIFDGIRFLDTSTDPGGAGFRSWAWTFGDGATAAGSGPVHQYAADGDYTVGLTVTTADGRTASTTGKVHVATHDVAITAFRVPTTARAGETRTITVRLRSFRYAETVQVDLMRSTGGFGFETVASRALAVPAKGRATQFDLTYAFTDGDAAAGKVSFKAVATLVNARDAQPADNTVIAPITVVLARTAGKP